MTIINELNYIMNYFSNTTYKVFLVIVPVIFIVSIIWIFNITYNYKAPENSCYISKARDMEKKLGIV